jgi:hypothetical protein
MGWTCGCGRGLQSGSLEVGFVKFGDEVPWEGRHTPGAEAPVLDDVFESPRLKPWVT